MKCFKRLTYIIFLLIFSYLFLTPLKANYPDRERTLLIFPDREITVSEFSRFISNNHIELIQENFDTVLNDFIEFHLKIAHARKERLDRKVEFINEITDYRISLAEPYLTHQKKRDFFIRQAYERLQYDLNVDQFLVKVNFEDIPLADTFAYYNKVVSIRNIILYNDKDEIQASSNEPDSIYEFQKLGYISAFNLNYEMENVVYRMAEGEISMPVKSQSGYLLFRLNNKKPVKNLPPFENIKDIISGKIEEANDSRIQSINNAFTEELKAYWDFRSFDESLDRYKIQLSKLNISAKDIIPMPENTGDPVCSIDGKAINIKDFRRYVNDTRDEVDPSVSAMPIEMQLDYFYEQFIDYRLFLYENYMLEKKYPEFKEQIRDYRDAMLLLAATQENVWKKSGSNPDITDNEMMQMWIKKLHESIPVEINAKAVNKIKQEYLTPNP